MMINKPLSAQEIQFTTEDTKFSFTPQEAHIFGGQNIFISFSNEETAIEDEFFYFITFEGSNLHHVTSAKVLNPYTLQAVIPDHDEAELVILSVHKLSSLFDSESLILGSDTFVFTSDSSQFLSKQLASNALNASTLLNLENVYASLLDIPPEEKKVLDAKLATSFRNTVLDTDWSLAPDSSEEDGKSWTLLHFCAKYHLPLLAEYLLCKPGSRQALQTMDYHERTPLDIAMQDKNKRMTEILSRSPCEEKEFQQSEVHRPSIKRHKLGTTTITNIVSKDKDDFTKDLMLLKELDKLAVSTTEPLIDDGGPLHNKDSSPLAESLKKLHEINEEIRRLRSISLKEDMEYEKDVEECTDSNANFIPDRPTVNPLEDNFIDLNDVNNSSTESIQEPSTDNSVEEIKPNDEYNDEVTTSLDDEEILNKDSPETVVPKQPELERKLSNLSVGKVEDVQMAEVIEILPTAFEEVMPVTEILPEIPVTDIDDEDGSTPEFNFKLESVTEETEEELQEDGSTLHRRHRHELPATQTRSLTDLPPHPPKRVGILKKSGSKKDRPLSDSFENLKMVERQGIVDMYEGGSNSLVGRNTEPGIARGHSLDALMTAILDRDDSLQSEPSSTSQLSLNGHHDSQDSLTSDYDSPKSRSRSGSGKLSISSHKASSLLSLNDIHLSRGSPASSQEDLRHGKRNTILSRITFKKAKSMSSLEMRDKQTSSLDEDRRKTFVEGLDIPLLPSKPVVPFKDESSRVTTDFEDISDDILVRYESGESEVPNSQSSHSVKNLDKEKNRRDDDYDTDEGTSADITGRHDLERKGSTDDKRKKKYHIFGGKPKDKKLQKDKEKEKKDNRERKDSDGKNKKKTTTSKSEFTLPGVKAELKTGFLANRGTSFRKNFKSSNDIKTSDKQMFTRASSTTNNSKYDATNKLLRSSDRRSPISGRKISSSIIEESHNDADMQPSLSKNLAGSRTSLDSLNLLNDDDTDAAYIAGDEQWDSDLDAKDEPETWSELVGKHIQRKMHAKDIKRQDVIYELIQTEAQYVRVLQIMRKIYAQGMVNILSMDLDVVNQIFPMIDDLIELNGNFLHAMKVRQGESTNYCIENIGDILRDFFGGENGEMLKQVYGHFCSRHLEAVAVYKDLLKNEKKYANFMKQCLLNDRSRRLSVPECITYVTIRMTKYPLLIEAIIKATKESKSDYDNLKSSLKLVKEVLVAVDEAVNIYEQQKELALLKKNLDRKNVVEIKSGSTKTVYKTTKLFHKRSRLLYDKKTVLKGKSKLHDARMIVLAEKIIFFQDNGGGKLQLLSADSKAPTLSLKNLMVREVATDNKALFLVSTSKDAAQIYEIICESYKDKKDFMPKLQRCIKECPDEEEENLTDQEEEARREEEERMGKLKEIIEQLQLADDKVANVLSDKNRLVHEMRELILSMDDVGQIKGSACELKAPDITNARITLESCINEVNQLSMNACVQQVDAPASGPPTPTPSVSTTSVNTLNKRSDTLSNYDARGSKPSLSYGNMVGRTNTTRSIQGRTGGTLETDSGKPRRQSQLLSVLSRTKTMGSTEDLTSLSSSTSINSLSTINTSLSQINMFQNVKDNLHALIDVTGKQDIEIGKMRYELQEGRNEVLKLRMEKKELEDKITLQQKEYDRQLRHERDQYAKLTREFKRTTEKLKLQNSQLKTGNIPPKPNSRSNSDDGQFV